MTKKIKQYRSGKRIYTHWDKLTEEVKVLPKKTKQTQQQLSIDKEIPEGKFSNMFTVSFSEGEFIIDFFIQHN
ncbi:MAG: hypothetical protein QME68_05375, partial [Elusimicrobiota bacterium]|nr:hypothetical protein [Elusimicrobiota bacterium]